MERRRRYLEPVIAPVLPRKLVFIGGPRQVGKTTLAPSLIGTDADETHPAYQGYPSSSRWRLPSRVK